MKGMFALKAHEDDNVATVFGSPEEGVDVRVEDSFGISFTVEATQMIPYGHKIALSAIPEGTDIIKYGEVIGRATADIGRGGHVHVQNVASLRGRGDIAMEKARGCGYDL